MCGCRALTECWNKCVPHIKDGELAIGEMTCVDRCVPKYFQVHTMVRDQYMAMNKAKEDQKRLREAFASAKNGVGGTADN